VTPYADSLKYLYSLQDRGVKLGLTTILRLLESVGNPQSTFPCIHVAGTNGKGSTAAFIASVLSEAGYVTGLYTSPHLVRFTERVRIDGREMPQQRLVKHVRSLRPIIEETRATFFEATTCIAFLYFAEENVDIAVIETGLGGRLDSTNVVTPLVSVITNVSREHTDYLGTSLKSIAREKAGIIKSRVPCVTAAHDPGVLTVLRRVARHRASALHRAQSVIRVAREIGGDRAVFSRVCGGEIRTRLGLRGTYQLQNARLALAAIELLSRTNVLSGPRLTRKAIAGGLHHVLKNTGIRGRMEVVAGRFVLDVAHNPAGTGALVDTIKRRRRDVSAVVFGVMRDKNMEEMLHSLQSITPLLIAVSPRVERARPVVEIEEECRNQDIPVEQGSSVGRGIARAVNVAPPKGIILITGSHYVVGEALSWLARKKLDNSA
jgi:dihydrofolate synthase / folylpolyglutamate synthase